VNDAAKAERQWWSKPKRIADRQKDRSVSFLELFYDLVYVVLIAQLAHALAAHPSVDAMYNFAFLFLFVWWAWLNGSLYHEMHGNNDLRQRVFTFAQMFPVASMAVFAHDALNTGFVGFAISFVVFIAITGYLWWSAGQQDPLHAAISNPYVISFGITAGFIIASLFVDPPWRFAFWGVGMALALVWPTYAFGIKKVSAELRGHIDQVVTLGHSAVERFGLFLIIVLGEVVVGAVSGVADQHEFTLAVGISAGLGVLVAIGLYWVYFDMVSLIKPKPTWQGFVGYLYSHLIIAMGIAAAGAAVLAVVAATGEPLDGIVRWLIVGSVALTLIAIAFQMSIVQHPVKLWPIYRPGRLTCFISAALILALGFTSLNAIPLLAITAFVILLPVFVSIRVWITRFDGAIDADWDEA